MLPTFLIIGAPRAATSWITRNLRLHPEIYLPRRKELHFFDRHYDRGIKYYMKYFEDRKEETAVGEATPAYLHGLYSDNDIPALIKKHLPHVKLIASLRNPVDRLYSRYWNAKAKFAENADLSFEEKIRQKPEFIEEGFYYYQLMRFFQLFPRERVLILLFDDLEANPDLFLEKIYSFLSVNRNFTTGFERTRVNAASSKKHLGKFEILWNLHRAFFRIGAFQIASFIEASNRRAIPPMKEETRKWLVNIYAEKNLKLQELIGRDLHTWNQIG